MKLDLEEDVLQGVLVAERFSNDGVFFPMTEFMPDCLLPLVNCTLLERALGKLLEAKVDEVFLFYCSFPHMIEDVIKRRWENCTMKIRLQKFDSSQILSAGDVMRELDYRGFIRSDFLFLDVFSVTSADLGRIVQEHKRLCTKDRRRVLTLAMCETMPRSGNVYSRHSDWSADFMMTSDERLLLLGAGDFRSNALIHGYTVHVHVLKDDYCGHVTSLPRYDWISQDIVRNKSFPLTPHTQPRLSSKDAVFYSCPSNFVYVAEPGLIPRSSDVMNSVIGPGTRVGKNCSFKNCIIGKDCIIEDGVRLERSYVWDKVKIGKNGSVESSLLCSEVSLGEGCCVSGHSVLGAKCTVESKECVHSQHLLPSTDTIDGSAASDNISSAVAVQHRFAERSQNLQLVVGDKESDISESEDDELMEDDFECFYKEYLDTLTRALEENIGFENLLLEIKSLRNAYNVSLSELEHVLVRSVVEYPLRMQRAESGHDGVVTSVWFAGIKKVIVFLKKVLLHFLKDDEDQIVCIRTLEDICQNEPDFVPLAQRVLKLLYDMDILSEESILLWHSSVPPNKKAFDFLKEQVSSFVLWLEEAEEESD